MRPWRAITSRSTGSGPHTDALRVESLTELERRRLAEAFEAVRKLQDATAVRFYAGGIA